MCCQSIWTNQGIIYSGIMHKLLLACWKPNDAHIWIKRCAAFSHVKWGNHVMCMYFFPLLHSVVAGKLFFPNPPRLGNHVDKVDLCSFLLKKSVVMCMVQTLNGKSYCCGTSIQLVHILVVILVKIHVEFQTISCLLCNK